LINNFSRNVIKELGNHSKKIFLEFTERTPLLTDKKVKEKITYLKKNGFLISIDDVGAGYNNISAILSIEPDLIKIDKVIVKNISIDSYKREAFKSILDLSKKMGSFVCAEGVEKEEDFLVLKELKPDYMQGYFLHFPEKMFQSLEKRKVV
jgi:EAL domain-containing protein (putative c-di-GMP-specific phosphodiesterase class I)